MVADLLVLVAGIAPLVAVAATAAVRVIHALGGFLVRPVGSQPSSFGMIVGHNLRLTGEGLLLLAGADFSALPAGAPAGFVMLHVVGVAVAACGIAVTARRFRRENLVAQVLLVGIAVNVVAYLTGIHAVILADAREMAPVLPFAAALAGRVLAGPLLNGPLLNGPLLNGPPLNGPPLTGYLAGLGLEISRPAATPQAGKLISWLERHPIGTGLSGYWEGNVVALTSGARVRVRPLEIADGRLVRPGDSQAAWYDPARSTADFVVFCPGVAGYPGFGGQRLVLTAFGEPARTFHVGRYTILLWHENLLARLGSAGLAGQRAAGPSPNPAMAAAT
jgi:hypothetical protein